MSCINFKIQREYLFSYSNWNNFRCFSLARLSFKTQPASKNSTFSKKLKFWLKIIYQIQRNLNLISCKFFSMETMPRMTWHIFDIRYCSWSITLEKLNLLHCFASYVWKYNSDMDEVRTKFASRKYPNLNNIILTIAAYSLSEKYFS